MAKHKAIVIGDLAKAKRGLAAIAATLGVEAEAAEVLIQHSIELWGELAQARKDADPSVKGLEAE